MRRAALVVVLLGVLGAAIWFAIDSGGSSKGAVATPQVAKAGIGGSPKSSSSRRDGAQELRVAAIARRVITAGLSGRTKVYCDSATAQLQDRLRRFVAEQTRGDYESCADAFDALRRSHRGRTELLGADEARMQIREVVVDGDSAKVTYRIQRLRPEELGLRLVGRRWLLNEVPFDPEAAREN
jgi:hypothetical protein